MEREHRQSIGNESGAGQMRFDHVSRLIERVCHRAGVEIGAALSVRGVEKHVRIRSLGHAEQLDHFAVEIDIFVQLHLLVVVQARPVPIRINGAEVDCRVAHRLQQQPFDRFAVLVQHLDLRVQRRSALRGLSFDDPGLAGFGIEGGVDFPVIP